MLDGNLCIFVRSFFSHFGPYTIATPKRIYTALPAKVQNYQIVIEIIYKTCSFFFITKTRTSHNAYHFLNLQVFVRLENYYRRTAWQLKVFYSKWQQCFISTVNMQCIENKMFVWPNFRFIYLYKFSNL